MELKLSHTTRMGVGRPPVCPYLVSAPCSDGDRGPHVGHSLERKMDDFGLSVIRRLAVTLIR